MGVDKFGHSQSNSAPKINLAQLENRIKNDLNAKNAAFNTSPDKCNDTVNNINDKTKDIETLIS